MRQRDWHATHLVKAVKGDPMHPSAYVPVWIDNRRIRITHSNRDKAIDWFAQWAAPRVTALGDHRNKILIPIPSSSSTEGSNPTFRTALIAEEIARRCGNHVIAFPFLRWLRAKLSARNGGTRDPYRLYENAAIAGDIPAGDCIVIDDVYTTGAHLKAAAWTLGDAMRSPVGAICCGRTTQVQLVDPFDVPQELIRL